MYGIHEGYDGFVGFILWKQELDANLKNHQGLKSGFFSYM